MYCHKSGIRSLSLSHELISLCLKERGFAVPVIATYHRSFVSNRALLYAALYVSFLPPSYVIALVTFPNNGFDRMWAPSRGTYQVSDKAEAKAPRQEVP